MDRRVRSTGRHFNRAKLANIEDNALKPGPAHIGGMERLALQCLLADIAANSGLHHQYVRVWVSDKDRSLCRTNRGPSRASQQMWHHPKVPREDRVSAT